MVSYSLHSALLLTRAEMSLVNSALYRESVAISDAAWHSRSLLAGLGCLWAYQIE